MSASRDLSPTITGATPIEAQPPAKVRCGDCAYFVRDGDCGYLRSPAGRTPGKPFEHAPFWVWSDCYSDREQVRANVTSLCPTFELRQSSQASGEGE